MASSAKPVKSEQIRHQEISCCEAHKGKIVTALVCAALALLVSGGVFNYFSVFKNIVCYSLMGAGGAVGLSATVTALIVYQVCTTSSEIKKPESKPKNKVNLNRKPYQPSNFIPKPPLNSVNHGGKPLSPTPLIQTPKPTPSWNELIKISDAPTLIAHLRSRQDSLSIVTNKDLLEDSLYVRTMALNPNETPMEMTRSFSDDVSVAFRLSKDLNATHLSLAQETFTKHNKLRARHLDLSGCSHMTLDPSILVHTSYTSLQFDGCPIVDINTFAEQLTLQKKLHTLSFGYETVMGPETFKKLIVGCPQLQHLTVAVDIKNEFLFIAPNKLKSLKIRVPALTPRVLENILICCPHLQHLTLWYSDVVSTPIGEILISCNPTDLKDMHFVIDAPDTHLENSHYTLFQWVQNHIDGDQILMKREVEIHMTHVYTESIFQSVTQMHEHHFWAASFLALVKRYANHPEKLKMLLMAMTQGKLAKNELNSLIEFGKILANHLNWIDWSSLEQVLAPLELNLQNSSNRYGLELILRCALASCQDKMVEEHSEDLYGSFYTWNSEVLNRLVN